MHLKKIKAVFFTLCCAVFIAGCATSDDVGRVQWEINDIRSEISAIKEKTESIKAGLPADNVVTGLEESQKATARSVADMFMKTQELSKEIHLITGRLEEVQNSAGKSLKDSEEITSEVNRMKTLVEEIEKRLSQLEMSPVFSKAGKEEEAKAVQTEEKKQQAVPQVKDAYIAAYESYKAGKTGEAREAFAAMLKDYPENEYSDNARFWVAESYYKDEDYEEAILAYEELFKKSPESEKIPGAMFKQGLAFYALKDAKTGKLILERLIERFPDSEEAKSAKKKLKESSPSKKKR
jgi:tol-pal system protein YbgF